MIRRPATSPLLPYATLFRSEAAAVASRVRQRFAPVCEAVLDAGFQIARNVAHELGPELMRDIARDLKASIEYGLAHRREALAHARGYSRGLRSEERRVGQEWRCRRSPYHYKKTRSSRRRTPRRR